MNTDMSVSLASVRPIVMPETLTCQCSWYTVSVHGLHGQCSWSTWSVFMVIMSVFIIT